MNGFHALAPIVFEPEPVQPEAPRYFAREWVCHAATSVGYEVAGRFMQVAECSGFGHPLDEAVASAAQIVEALNGYPELRAVEAARAHLQHEARYGREVAQRLDELMRRHREGASIEYADLLRVRGDV